tara:strand:- start:680 stop:1147 length:468 start_codon:yes stop_codon:yes gene_type:complete
VADLRSQKILPDLQCSLPCEDIRQERNGNFILIGIMPFIRVPQLPVTMPRMCIMSRWANGLGEFIESTRLIGLEGGVLNETKVKFVLEDPAHNATNIALFANWEIKNPGIYHIEVLVDDVLKLRYPFNVILAPPPEQQQQPAAEGEGEAPAQEGA